MIRQFTSSTLLKQSYDKSTNEDPRFGLWQLAQNEWF